MQSSGIRRETCAGNLSSFACDLSGLVAFRSRTGRRDTLQNYFLYVKECF